MKPIIFDGRAFAKKRETALAKKIKGLKKKPTMAAIIVGSNPASKLYVGLKQKAAERVGIELDIYEFPESISSEELIRKITHLNLDPNLDGLMVQLPLPKNLLAETEHIISHIPPRRDVDGLRANSPFVHATARAVITILKEAKKKVKISSNDFVVVIGSAGMVGRSVVAELKKAGFRVGTEISEAKKAKVIISATGEANLINKKHVAKGAVVIDVGSPNGDINFEEVKKIASFITPVPGGVGPVTVVSLLESLVDSKK